MKILLLDIAWLAGILEGEGSFWIRKNRGVQSSVSITIQMTDKDIVEKVSNLFDRPMFGPHVRADKPTAKPVYSTSTTAQDAAAWMMTLYPLMGKRRQEKIREVLEFWRSRPIRRAA